MNFKSARNFLILLILTLVLIWFFFNFEKDLKDIRSISFVNPLLIVILILLFLLNQYFIGFVNRELLIPFGIRMDFFISFLLSIVNSFYNMLAPFRAGMAVRAVYLKQRYDLTYTNFLANTSAMYILSFLSSSFFGLLSTILIYIQTGAFSWILFFIFFLVFVLMWGIIIISPRFKERKNKWLNRFIKVINGWHLIKGNFRAVLVTSVMTVVQIMIGSLMVKLQFLVFGVEISFLAGMFLSAIGFLSLLISITPGNLGVQEAIIVFSATTIGITPAESLSAALLGRAVSLVVLFILGPIFSYVLLKNNKNKKGKEYKQVEV